MISHIRGGAKAAITRENLKFQIFEYFGLGITDSGLIFLPIQ